jgi:hypothetical protein
MRQVSLKTTNCDILLISSIWYHKRKYYCSLTQSKEDLCHFSVNLTSSSDLACDGCSSAICSFAQRGFLSSAPKLGHCSSYSSPDRRLSRHCHIYKVREVQIVDQCYRSILFFSFLYVSGLCVSCVFMSMCLVSPTTHFPLPD